MACSVRGVKMAVRDRARIRAPEVRSVNGLNPLSDVAALKGIRVYDIGQGDAIAVIDGQGEPVLHVDYGGRQGNPFMEMPAAQRSMEVDLRLPIDPRRFVMITHWDEDHWCSASKGEAAKAANWLVPRQVTSPTAVAFSTQIPRISCIPEIEVGNPHFFRAANGDELWWEKIAPSESDESRSENCNKTGVAFSLLRHGPIGSEVILMPGDAPFDSVGHYRQHASSGATLTGIVAFHHGADTHWTAATRNLLRNWQLTHNNIPVIFSCGVDNSYHHPTVENYQDIYGWRLLALRTDELRRSGAAQGYELVFR
jgi:hypothetical protein